MLVFGELYSRFQVEMCVGLLLGIKQQIGIVKFALRVMITMMMMMKGRRIGLVASVLGLGC